MPNKEKPSKLVSINTRTLGKQAEASHRALGGEIRINSKRLISTLMGKTV